jgi:hypothetical protein
LFNFFNIRLVNLFVLDIFLLKLWLNTIFSLYLIVSFTKAAEKRMLFASELIGEDLLQIPGKEQIND